jgi:hypothetical protein
MAEEKKITDLALASFYEAMENTNTEKITNEMLAGLSENSSDSESFGIESEDENAEDRSWRPSHVVFGKSAIKQGQIESMKGKYFHDVSIVRAGGEDTVPLPESDEVVVIRSFMKAGLRFLLHKMLVDVLKTFEIYLHQITPKLLLKWGLYLGHEEPRTGTGCKMLFAIFMSCLTRQRQLERNSITIILVVTASCLDLRRVILCPRFGRGGRALGCRNGFT